MEKTRIFRFGRLRMTVDRKHSIDAPSTRKISTKDLP